MRIIKFLALVFLSVTASAKASLYIVDNVKVSATADSAASAREKAIQQGYTEAYNKLMIRLGQEGAPTRPDAPDPQDLMSMVLDFSVDREKNTSTSYSALMTFQFDPKKMDDWISGLDMAIGQNLNPATPETNSSGHLTVFIPVTNLSDLMDKSTAILKIPGVKAFHLKEVTTRGALAIIETGHTPEALLKATNEKNINVIIQ